MKRHELILFFLTFFFGLFCGMLLYVFVYAPAYKNSNLTDISQLGFQLSGQAYGRCQTGTMVCPSFVLNADGSYQYIPWYSSTADTPKPITGTLSSSQLNSIENALKTADYTALQQASSVCAADSGGTDYQYNVVINGAQQELDTCHTEFGQSALATKLAPLWNAFRTSQTSGTQQTSESLGTLLQKQIQTWFPAGHQNAR
jgi:hypothetical protein